MKKPTTLSNWSLFKVELAVLELDRVPVRLIVPRVDKTENGVPDCQLKKPLTLHPPKIAFGIREVAIEWPFPTGRS